MASKSPNEENPQSSVPLESPDKSPHGRKGSVQLDVTQPKRAADKARTSATKFRWHLGSLGTATEGGRRSKQDLSWEENTEEKIKHRSSVLIWSVLAISFGALSWMIHTILSQKDLPPKKEFSLSSPGWLNEEGKTGFAGKLPMEVAQEFLAETDPARRLQMARNPAEVGKRLDQYPQQALSESQASKTEFPIVNRDGMVYFRFGIVFEDESKRLLCVVPTDDGLKVDWDAFAQYGTIPWEELITGKVTQEIIRVVVEPGEYYNYEFSNSTNWQCYVLKNPHEGDIFYTYFKRGSDEDLRLQKSIQNTNPNEVTSCFTLVVSSDPEFPERRILKTEKILVAGWVLPDS